MKPVEDNGWMLPQDDNNAAGRIEASRQRINFPYRYLRFTVEDHRLKPRTSNPFLPDRPLAPPPTRRSTPKVVRGASMRLPRCPKSSEVMLDMKAAGRRNDLGSGLPIPLRRAADF
jgi:hypothetical protein